MSNKEHSNGTADILLPISNERLDQQVRVYSSCVARHIKESHEYVCGIGDKKYTQAEIAYIRQNNVIALVDSDTAKNIITECLESMTQFKVDSKAFIEVSNCVSVVIELILSLASSLVVINEDIKCFRVLRHYWLLFKDHIYKYNLTTEHLLYTDRIAFIHAAYTVSCRAIRKFEIENSDTQKQNITEARKLIDSVIYAYSKSIKAKNTTLTPSDLLKTLESNLRATCMDMRWMSVYTSPFENVIQASIDKVGHKASYNNAWCSNCKKQEKDKVRLMICSNCKRASYCSKECQNMDWSKHKNFCTTKPTA